jgi:nitrate/TMAO reductase-like tetraheme cytochrome c subunit
MDLTGLRSRTETLLKKCRPSWPAGRFNLATAVRRHGPFAVIPVLLVLLGLGVSGATLAVTSSTGFCMACHEMKPYKEELALSSHAKDAEGQEIDCSRCHLPRGVGPRYLAVKTYSGLKVVYTHFTEEPLNLDRRALQTVARRFMDDASCLSCHEDLYKDAKGTGAISELGRLTHDTYNGLDGKTYRNCAACHINIAHLPVFDRRLEVNRDFAERLAGQERKEAVQ